ncbi:MAG: Wzz/FepE/Etk N-terminal domain-containing protein [Chloroflexota bacterium]
MAINLYAIAVAKRWWIVLSFTVLGVGSGYFFSTSQAPVYRATTTILIGQSLQDAQPNRNTIIESRKLAPTYADLARQQSTLEAVIADLDLPIDWQTLQRQIIARPIADTALLEIDVQAASWPEAERIVNQLAMQLILQSATATQVEQQQVDQTQKLTHLRELEKQIMLAEDEIINLETQIRETTSPQRVQQLRQQVNQVKQSIHGWEQEYDTALSLLQVTPVADFLTVVETAYGSSTPVQPQMRLILTLGGILGVLLGLGAVFLLEKEGRLFSSS